MLLYFNGMTNLNFSIDYLIIAILSTNHEISTLDSFYFLLQLALAVEADRKFPL